MEGLRRAVASTRVAVRQRWDRRGEAGLMLILITVLILGISAAIVLHSMGSQEGCSGERSEIIAAYRLGRESGGLSHNMFLDGEPEFFVLEAEATTKAIERAPWSLESSSLQDCPAIGLDEVPIGST